MAAVIGLPALAAIVLAFKGTAWPSLALGVLTFTIASVVAFRDPEDPEHRALVRNGAAMLCLSVVVLTAMGIMRSEGMARGATTTGLVTLAFCSFSVGMQHAARP